MSMIQNRKTASGSGVESALRRAKDKRSALPGFSSASREQDEVSSNASRLLGEVLVQQGKLKPGEIQRILEHAERKNLSFGDAAVALRLISRADREHAVAEQFDYPYLVKGTGGHSSKLVAAYDPFSRKGERYRNLRAKLLLRWDGSHRKTLAVVAPKDSASSYLIAANLAVTFSQSGTRTLFVDADFSSSRRKKLFRLENEQGLSAVLLGRSPIKAAVQPLQQFRNLSILPSGSAPPNPGDLMARQQWAEMIAELRRSFQVIIFNSPPFEDNAGAEIVARRCGSVLLVVQKNKTYLSDVKSLLGALRDSDSEVVGSVITKS